MTDKVERLRIALIGVRCWGCYGSGRQPRGQYQTEVCARCRGTGRVDPKTWGAASLVRLRLNEHEDK